MIKAIIFDVDGTLLDTERIYIQAWQESGIRHGFPIPMEALMKTRAVNAAVATAVFQEYCGQDFPYETIRNTRVEIAEAMIAKETPAQLCKPHAAQVLKQLLEKGYTLGVASSTSHAKTVEHLEHAGLLHYFSVIVGGDMVKNGKPNPDIFLLAAEKAGAKPEECLVVGDSPADVQASHAAGIPVILIPDQVPANGQTTALSLHVLNELQELLSIT